MKQPKLLKFFLSDGLIITGNSTGHEANINEIENVKKNVKIPVLVGSGVTLNNLESYFNISDAMIVGSYFKKNGYWANELDYDKIANFMEKVKN